MHELFPSGPTMLFRVKEWQIRGLRISPGAQLKISTDSKPVKVVKLPTTSRDPVHFGRQSDKSRPYSESQVSWHTLCELTAVMVTDPIPTDFVLCRTRLLKQELKRQLKR